MQINRVRAQQYQQQSNAVHSWAKTSDNTRTFLTIWANLTKFWLLNGNSSTSLHSVDTHAFGFLHFVFMKDLLAKLLHGVGGILYML